MKAAVAMPIAINAPPPRRDSQAIIDGCAIFARRVSASSAYTSALIAARPTKVAIRMANCGNNGFSTAMNCGTNAIKNTMDFGLNAVTAAACPNTLDGLASVTLSSSPCYAVDALLNSLTPR